MSALQTQPQPILKWAGGKRQLQERITALFPVTFKTYFEPFFGGGAIYFKIRPQSGVISDLNSSLINVYETVKEQSADLILELRKLQNHYNGLSPSEQEALFYKIRDEFNYETRLDLSGAKNFIFLNKAGFNGMYRENKSGMFNVPFGRRPSINLFDEENFLAVSETLKTARILNANYLEVSKLARKGDLVYLDPPYVPISATSTFTSYQANGFELKDQEILAEEFRRLDSKGVFVALSNSKSEIVKNLYKGFNFHELSATRNISAHSKGRDSVIEYLVTNF